LKKSKVILMILIFFFAIGVFAKPNTMKYVDIQTKQDSIDVNVALSLFYEDYKNKMYESALVSGWKLIKFAPDACVKYRVYKKMEDAITKLYNNEKTTPEMKAQLADTILYVYDEAIKHQVKKAGLFWAKKGYVLQVWHKADPKLIEEAYLNAFKADPNLSTSYKDRLGLLYMQLADENEEYRNKAISLYSDLSQAEPEVARWNDRLRQLAGGDIEQLMDIQYQAWQMNKNNLEKAWAYASACIRGKEYEKAIEPLKYLTEKSPTVINYWKQLANAYQKIENNDESIRALKKLVELDPNNKENYLNLGIQYQNMKQFSVSRSYLYKAMKLDPDWDFPIYLEGQLYEQTARNCIKGSKIDFMDKCVFQLAVDTYKKAATKTGRYADLAKARIAQFSTTVPQQEDYFYRKYSKGDVIKIKGKCYNWINRTIIAK